MASFAKEGMEWPVAKVRQTFIDYFVQKQGHRFWESAPVVPLDDPTLLFINAGMNQYKPLFLGTCDPSLEMSTLKRAVNSQKCIRAGGKHNDLDDVGKDVYHHTYFEMLGNWSFGDYFKKEAIEWAWECLTVEYGLNPDRLYATYFGGDASQGLEPDNEAKEIWLQFLPENRVLPFDCKDNFWEMGATGPCGPCSEIHYDRIGDRFVPERVNADHPDLIEIWNLVFIQFNRETDLTLKTLPNQHVDTGMGLERISSILQGKDSNYDTDIFTPIFDAIQAVAGCRAYSGKVGDDDVDKVDMAYRVVADHIRNLTFAITDGAMPSSTGRGYVLRRILRRAVRYGQEILGAPNGFFTTLVPVVVQNFSNHFPELIAKEAYVMSVLADEETTFVRTLMKGVKYFQKVVESCKASGSTVVPAEETHRLFGSLGFPVDLTELMAEEKGMTVDVAGFDLLMERDRQISEQARLGKGGSTKDMTMVAEQTAWLQDNGVAATNADNKYTWNEDPVATVTALFTGRGQEGAGFAEHITVDDGLVAVICDQTSYYYESGGQIFDTGLIEAEDGSWKLKVENCQTYAGYVLHIGYLEKGSKISVGAVCKTCVDYERRGLVAPNHTMTHVLNYALRTVLVDEGLAANPAAVQANVDQKGSLVDEDKLRFDFSWNSGLKADQLARVEQLVNAQISAQLPVYAEVVPLAAAQEIQSLRCVFGERYPDPVRVISVGHDVQVLLADPKNDKWSGNSVEFCGGTHLTNTKQAELFVIVEEAGIAKGIRRITAFTKRAAQMAKSLAMELSTSMTKLEGLEVGKDLNAGVKVVSVKVDGAQISVVDKAALKARLSKLTDKLKAWQKTQVAVRTTAAVAVAEAEAAKAMEAGAKATVLVVPGVDAAVNKKVQDAMKKVHSSGSFFVASVDEDKGVVGLFPVVTKEHVKAGLSAKDWVDSIFAKVGAGKGGGKAEAALGTVPGGETLLGDIVAAAQAYVTSKGM
jgi:alanyl-tRNA synthetase